MEGSAHKKGLPRVKDDFYHPNLQQKTRLQDNHDYNCEVSNR